ncbi:MAG: DUF1566 domain-containing protein [Methylovulum sp.]|nr:DUF1566 domain-containing protein [Methylovulum sp.]
MNKKQWLFHFASLLPLLLGTPAHAALEGDLDGVSCNSITGWAWDNTQPTAPIKIDIYDVTTTKTALLATLMAQQFQANLLNAGKGDGKHGFTYVLPARIRTAVKHQFSVRYHGTITELAHSPKTTLSACYGKLNDTGNLTCSDISINGLGCPVPRYKGQDGDYGRDALARANKLAKTGKGKGGFDFTKIANDGLVLSANASLGTRANDWACTRDNVTGLLWEVKTTDGGLRDSSNTYSWYNPDDKTNGGFAGYKNGGICKGGVSCNTQAYANAANALKLCGKSGWRIPSKAELDSIVDAGSYSPAIDGTYFPNTVYGAYWSSSPVAGFINNSAWRVNFQYGYDYWNFKIVDNYVRLVHSGQ